MFLSFLLSACMGGDSGGSGTPALPPASGPIAGLAAGTEMPVRGNHTGYWRRNLNCSAIPTPANCPNTDEPNQNGPKLQRLDVSDASSSIFIAVFRNNITLTDFGKALFTMPAAGGVVTGTTDLGYKFTITNNNQQLIYALTGLFQIANNPVTNPNRFAYGGYVAGSQTATSDLPNSGSITYNGTFIGQSTSAGLVTGTVSLTANFAAATDQISGSLAGMSGGMNDFSISATIDPLAVGDGSYVGQLVATSAGTFAITTTGIVDGGFYGPGGVETGGTIRVVNGTEILTGAFGGN